MFGHDDGVLELCGQRAVAGDHGPTVVEVVDREAAQVDHRLNGEGHALAQGRSAPRTPVVGHAGLGVEQPADAVAGVFPHHRAALGRGESLDGRADVTDVGAGSDLLDADLQALAGHLDHVAGQRTGGPHVEGHRGVAVKAVAPRVDGRDIDVDDVAVLQYPLLRDAVADHFVDAGADALGETSVVQRGGHRVLGQGELVDQAIDVLGGDPRHDVGPDHHQCLGRQLAGRTHLPDFLGAVDAHAGHGDCDASLVWGGETRRPTRRSAEQDRTCRLRMRGCRVPTARPGSCNRCRRGRPVAPAGACSRSRRRSSRRCRTRRCRYTPART